MKNEVKQAESLAERTRQDSAFHLSDTIEKLTDRLIQEKQADLEALNKRNELLIKSLVETNTLEAKNLREELLKKDKVIRKRDQDLAEV